MLQLFRNNLRLKLQKPYTPDNGNDSRNQGGDPELGLRYAKWRYVKFQWLKQWKFVIARLSIA